MADFQYGDDLIGFCKLESSYGTPVKPAATNAFRAVSMAMGYVENRPVLNDRRGTRSQMERISGRSSATWSASILFRPSGTAGTAPDWDELMELAFGTKTTVGGTSVTYSLLQDLTGKYASIYRRLTDIDEFVYGAICQNVTISWRGNDLIRLDFSGVAKAFGETGNAVAASQQSNTTTLTVDDADFFTTYSIIQIGTDTNGGAGYQLSAANYTSEVLTLESAATWANSAAVAPYLPTGTFAGAPVYGSKGSLSLDNGISAVNYLGGSVSISTGVDLLNEEAGSTNPTDVVMTGRRMATVSLDFLIRKTETYYMSHFRRRQQKDLKIILGDTAGSIMTIDMNQVEIDPSARDVPETGLARVSLTGVALGSSGEDELTVALT